MNDNNVYGHLNIFHIGNKNCLFLIMSMKVYRVWRIIGRIRWRYHIHGNRGTIYICSSWSWGIGTTPFRDATGGIQDCIGKLLSMAGGQVSDDGMRQLKWCRVLKELFFTLFVFILLNSYIYIIYSLMYWQPFLLRLAIEQSQ